MRRRRRVSPVTLQVPVELIAAHSCQAKNEGTVMFEEVSAVGGRFVVIDGRLEADVPTEYLAELDARMAEMGLL